MEIFKLIDEKKANTKVKRIFNMIFTCARAVIIN